MGETYGFPMVSMGLVSYSFLFLHFFGDGLKRLSELMIFAVDVDNTNIDD